MLLAAGFYCLFNPSPTYIFWLICHRREKDLAPIINYGRSADYNSAGGVSRLSEPAKEIWVRITQHYFFNGQSARQGFLNNMLIVYEGWVELLPIFNKIYTNYDKVICYIKFCIKQKTAIKSGGFLRFLNLQSDLN